MSDDFQAQPPRPPDGAELAPSTYDRFEEVNLRKPDSEPYDWHGVGVRLAVSCLIGFGLIVVIVFSSTISSNQRPTFVYGSTIGPRVAGGQVLRDPLDGTWIATAVIVDGEDLPPDDLAQFKLVIDSKSGQFSLDLPGTTHQGSYKVTNTLSPKEIDFTSDTGVFSVRGIYADKGSLLICFAQSERPTDFTAEKGSRRTLLALKHREER
jgi:uncharacterized protein (TIGR03067 family)